VRRGTRRGLLLEWGLVDGLCICRGSGDERRVSWRGRGRCRRKLLGLAGDNVRMKNHYKLIERIECTFTTFWSCKRTPSTYIAVSGQQPISFHFFDTATWLAFHHHLVYLPPHNHIQWHPRSPKAVARICSPSSVFKCAKNLNVKNQT
jgi:hypothetical protein